MAEAKRINKDDVMEMLDNPQVTVLDLRLDTQWQDSDSRIKGALHENPHDLESWVSKYDKDKTLILYCA